MATDSWNESISGNESEGLLLCENSENVINLIEDLYFHNHADINIYEYDMMLENNLKDSSASVTGDSTVSKTEGKSPTPNTMFTAGKMTSLCDSRKEPGEAGSCSEYLLPDTPTGIQTDALVPTSPPCQGYADFELHHNDTNCVSWLSVGHYMLGDVKELPSQQVPETVSVSDEKDMYRVYSQESPGSSQDHRDPDRVYSQKSLGSSQDHGNPCRVYRQESWSPCNSQDPYCQESLGSSQDLYRVYSQESPGSSQDLFRVYSQESPGNSQESRPPRHLDSCAAADQFVPNPSIEE